jgi:protocatechuate 3,4-dioxygenase beta subunit
MLLTFILSLAVLQAAARQADQDPARTGEVRGRITEKETGQPLSRAIVRLHRVDGSERLTTRTNEAGFYRFVGLAPGEYRDGIVEAGEFRATHVYGVLGDASRPGRPILLEAGEVREMNVALPRAHAISVRVVDEWGDPLSGLRLTAYSADDGRTAAAPMNHTTDDHGRLRVFGLPSGRYIVCAEAHFVGSSSSRRREGYLRTCHPSASHDAEAQPVRLAGADAGEIEIRMRRGRTFTISGRVVDASGAPAASPLVSLARFEPNGSSSTTVSVDGESRFTISNVHPGEYAIEASLGGSERPEQRRPLEESFLPIRVDRADVEDLLVSMHRAVEVSGRITLEDPTAAFPGPSDSVLSMWSRLADDQLAGMGSVRAGFVRADRVFTLAGVFGRRTLELMNVPRGWYVKSIRYRGREIVDTPVEFKESSDPSLLEVVLSNRGAVVTGRAIDEAGNPVARARVVLLRDDGGRAGVQMPIDVMASAAGEFRLGPVRRGDYLIVALARSAPWVGPRQRDRLARLAAAAERITLGELDERAIDLRVMNER